MTTKLGFIGLGGMGLHQARSFAAVRGCRVAAGSDPSRQSCANFAKEFADADVCADHRTLLKNTDVDAVVIAAPTLFHKQIAIDAMHSGRPVMVEKPMARTVADARRMNDVARKTGQPLMVAHCRRYDTDWGTFARVWRSGKLGSPALWRHVSSSAGPPTPWWIRPSATTRTARLRSQERSFLPAPSVAQPARVCTATSTVATKSGRPIPR